MTAPLLRGLKIAVIQAGYSTVSPLENQAKLAYNLLMDFSLVQKIILWVVPLIFAITVHEVSHGFVANYFGDPTAKLLGRLTLNPIRHIDPIGTLLIPAASLLLGGFLFGYAKPVPVNFGRLKNPNRDGALVALAGPFSNLLMALAWAGIAKVALLTLDANTLTFNALYFMASSGIIMNIAFMILNLIPLPPLDGSRVVMSILKGKWYRYYLSIEPYGFWILLGLLLIGVLGRILTPAIYFFVSLITSWFGLT